MTISITNPPTASNSFTSDEPTAGSPFTSNLAASLVNDIANPSTNTTTFESTTMKSSTKSTTVNAPTSPPAVTTFGVDTSNVNAPSAAQQANVNPAAANNVDFNVFAAQMLQQFSTPEGRAQLQQMQQMQVRITQDGRIIPNPSKDCVLVYIKNVVPRPPTNLEHIDGVLWNDFSLRLAPITRQIKLTMFMLMAYGVLSAILCAVTVRFAESPFAIPGVMVGISICFFCFVCIVGKKWKKMNEQVKGIVTEFAPKFQIKGYGLEYFDTVGLLVVTRVPSSV